MGSGEFTSPNGGVKPPLHETNPLPMREVLQRGCWPQPKRKLPCPLWPSSSNTEHTERLRGLCVEAFLTTEGAETLHTAGKIFVAREEVDC
jgi:hypothetical protein